MFKIPSPFFFLAIFAGICSLACALTFHFGYVDGAASVKPEDLPTTLYQECVIKHPIADPNQDLVRMQQCLQMKTDLSNSIFRMRYFTNGNKAVSLN